MSTLWDGRNRAGLHYDGEENICVRMALQNLGKDLIRVGAPKIRFEDFLPSDPGGKLLVGTLKNKRFAEYLENAGIRLPELEEKWEHYTIRTIGAEGDTCIGNEVYPVVQRTLCGILFPELGAFSG